MRNHKVLFEKKNTGSEEEIDFHWTQSYQIIECLGCETISFLSIYGNSEMFDYDEAIGEGAHFTEDNIYPPYLEEGKEIEHLYYLPKNIQLIYQETILAFKLKSYILTAGGFRAIIEALCNHLKIKNKNLLERIDLLNAGGFLTLKESRRLHSIRFLGNDALHQIETPKKEHLLILLDIINHLLENLFVHDRRMNNVDSIIDTYEGFIDLLERKISKKSLGQELKLSEILEKSKRLIKTDDLKTFSASLQKNIDEAKYDLVSYRVQSKTIYLTILKKPQWSSL